MRQRRTVVLVHGGPASYDHSCDTLDIEGPIGDDEVAELARTSFGSAPVTDDEWARVFAVFGPRVPDETELARRRQNLELAPYAVELMRRVDLVDQLRRIDCPTLV
jgi:pimeloyl-ACP methyl ester carboxylesterase